jgi:hypothetical protein
MFEGVRTSPRRQATQNMTPSRNAAVKAKKVSKKSEMKQMDVLESVSDELVFEETEQVQKDLETETEQKDVETEQTVLVEEEEPFVEEKEVITEPVSPVRTPRTLPIPKSVPAIKTAKVITSSPLRKVVFSRDDLDLSTSPIKDDRSAKRKREETDENDQENVIPNFTLPNEGKGKRVRMPDGTAAKSVQPFHAPPLVHQSWLDRRFSKLSKTIFGFM